MNELLKRRDPEKIYYYKVKVERHHQCDPSFVFRTYREFVEFYEKLQAKFTSYKFRTLIRPSNLMRSNTREAASGKRIEILHFLNDLMTLAEEISHSDLVYTFFHPILRDQEGLQQSVDKSMAIASPPGNFFQILCSSIYNLSLGSLVNSLTQKYGLQQRNTLYGAGITGQIKLSIVYKNGSLILMIMHAKNLKSNRSQSPDCYVKTYLLPDLNKMTKRKTRIVRNSCHPTFMEMIVYQGYPIERVKERRLQVCLSILLIFFLFDFLIFQVSVWEYDRVTENMLIGATSIFLNELDLRKETVHWYSLGGTP